MASGEQEKWVGGPPPTGGNVDIITQSERGILALVNVEPAAVEWDGSGPYKVLSWQYTPKPLTDEEYAENKKAYIAEMNSSLKPKIQGI